MTDDHTPSPRSYARIMQDKLTAALSPTVLELADDSHQHQGHGGWREGGETHFSLYIVSQAFEGKSRVERQRMVYAVLAEELAGQVHALQIKALAPSQI
jgi:BolA family transcriptional regulator, general stress-responsive regulator